VFKMPYSEKIFTVKHVFFFTVVLWYPILKV
jgi:hypothetical protein